MNCYLDNSATTRCFDSVAELTAKIMCKDYGNPSSLHQKGVEAEAYVRIGENTVWIPSDVRTWKSGKETMLLVDLPLADGAVYFGIRRRSDGRPIYLAHECEEDGSVKIGEFLI